MLSQSPSDMIQMFKILKGKHNPELCEMNKQETRGHEYKTYKQHTRVNTSKFSFIRSNRNITCRITFPQAVSEAPSVQSFKNGLDNLWKNKLAESNNKEGLNTNIKNEVLL